MTAFVIRSIFVKIFREVVKEQIVEVIRVRGVRGEEKVGWGWRWEVTYSGMTPLACVRV